MASLDSLPADQHAVLQLVLQRGRSYDDIAQLLSIDRAAVRERALGALDAIGPQTGVPPERRGLITDYLLGQLPPRVMEQTRERLAQSAGERAWARVVASELSPLSGGPLSEIPVESTRRAPPVVAPASSPSDEPATVPSSYQWPEPDRQFAEPEPQPPEPAGQRPPSPPPLPPPEPQGARGSSRLGGAVLLGGGALVAVVVVLVIVLASSGDSSKHTSREAPAASAPTPTSSTPATSTGPQPVSQVNLSSPTGSKKTAGAAEVVRQGSNTGIVIVAQGIPPNTSHDAYAVWLYNSPSDNHILGFVNPGVKTNGRLQTAGVLPTNASHFKELLVTLETQAKPAGPGQIVLQGALKLAQ
jgi:hypothetical protein